MLDKILSFIADYLNTLSKRTVLRQTATYSVPALASGAKGYWTIPRGTQLPEGALIIGNMIQPTPLNSVLQTQVLNQNRDSIYVQYNALGAISANSMTLSIYTAYRS